MKINKISFKKNKEEWEDLAELDVYWAILTDPQKKFGRWNIKDFLLTGEKEIDDLMRISKKLGYPSKQEIALDFGCGVGRLTRQLAKYFKKCCGIDISKNMIAKTKELNRNLSNCEFIVNEKENLALFRNDYFDLIYTRLVLQHLPDEDLIKNYISEFIRILKKDGLLVFQLPNYIPLKLKIDIRAKLYKILKKLGINKRFLYNKIKNIPLTMNSIPEKEVTEFLKSLNAKILKVEKDRSAGTLIKSRIYYITK